MRSPKSTVRHVSLITRNREKLMAAKAAFSKYGIGVQQITKKYYEIQADSSVEIARHTALHAAKIEGIPVIREDHSFFIRAFGGMPGPYIAYIERWLSADLLARAMRGFKDRRAYFELAAVYATPEGRFKEYINRVEITLAPKPVGRQAAGWNRLMMFKGDSRTFAQYPEEERTMAWSGNFLSIAKDLSEGRLMD